MTGWERSHTGARRPGKGLRDARSCSIPTAVQGSKADVFWIQCRRDLRMFRLDLGLRLYGFWASRVLVCSRLPVFRTMEPSLSDAAFWAQVGVSRPSVLHKKCRSCTSCCRTTTSRASASRAPGLQRKHAICPASGRSRTIDTRLPGTRWSRLPCGRKYALESQSASCC